MDEQFHHQSAYPWYFDAIFYGIDLARFKDSDANGYGDFKGLIAELDYVEWLGIDAIWLLPFYRSPRVDNGYDVADHYEIDPRLGTTGDFVAFLREAEHRNIRVLIDLVINHTSNEHRWFKESRDPDSDKRDWYVWTDDLDSVPDYPVIFPPNQKMTWTWEDASKGWYLHHFHDFEPDLNTHNEELQAEIRNMVEYWIRLGVRGFRVDGAPFLGQKRTRDPGEAQEVLHNIHVWAKDIHEETVLLPEANLDPDGLKPYAVNGDAQMLFNFLADQYMFLAFATEQAEPLQRVLKLMPPGDDSLRWITFLRNQDELTLEQLTEDERHKVLEAFSPDPDTHVYDRGSRRRLAPLLHGDRRRMEMAFSLMFAFPGIPLFIAGDEIGMGDNLKLHEREAARLPMQWTLQKPNGGFSEAQPDDLVTPVLTHGPFGIDKVNVEEQRGDEGSFLQWVRALIDIRKTANTWMHHKQTRVQIPAPSVFVIAYVSDDEDSVLVTAHNLADSPVTLDLDGAANVTSRLKNDSTDFHGDESLELGPFGYAWWEQADVPVFSQSNNPVPAESNTP